jgi:hypothetical protein
MPLCTKRNLILIFNFLLFLSGAAAGVGGVQENEYGKISSSNYSDSNNRHTIISEYS